jgi:hypothetical protein
LKSRHSRRNMYSKTVLLIVLLIIAKMFYTCNIRCW